MPDGILDLLGAFFNLLNHTNDIINVVNEFLNAKKEAEKKADALAKKAGIPIKIRLASIHTKDGLHLGILIDLPNDDWERAVIYLLRAFGEHVEVLNCTKQP